MLVRISHDGRFPNFKLLMFIRKQFPEQTPWHQSAMGMDQIHIKIGQLAVGCSTSHQAIDLPQEVSFPKTVPTSQSHQTSPPQASSPSQMNYSHHSSSTLILIRRISRQDLKNTNESALCSYSSDSDSCSSRDSSTTMLINRKRRALLRKRMAAQEKVRSNSDDIYPRRFSSSALSQHLSQQQGMFVFVDEDDDGSMSCLSCDNYSCCNDEERIDDNFEDSP